MNSLHKDNQLRNVGSSDFSEYAQSSILLNVIQHLLEEVSDLKRQLLAQEEEADFKRKLLVHDHGQNKTDAIHKENSKCKAVEKDKYFKENIHKNQRRSADQTLRYAEIVRGSSNKFDYNKTRISLNKRYCKFCLEKHI